VINKKGGWRGKRRLTALIRAGARKITWVRETRGVEPPGLRSFLQLIQHHFHRSKKDEDWTGCGTASWSGNREEKKRIITKIHFAKKMAHLKANQGGDKKNNSNTLGKRQGRRSTVSQQTIYWEKLAKAKE